MLTYRTNEAAAQDKVDLALLLEALNVSPSIMRRDGCETWILRGRPGCFACTWGDGKSWHLVVAPEQELSRQAWTWIKKRLAFCELTQDGDAEGVFRLHRLSVPAEADEIRDILGLRKRVDTRRRSWPAGRNGVGV